MSTCDRRALTLYRTQGVWRADQSHDAGICSVWICRVLRHMSCAELVVLYETQRLRQESLGGHLQ
jgi:hypothetical protein